jgi:ketol-acid reductoisomerase
MKLMPQQDVEKKLAATEAKLEEAEAKNARQAATIQHERHNTPWDHMSHEAQRRAAEEGARLIEESRGRYNRHHRRIWDSEFAKRVRAGWLPALRPRS